MNNIGGTITAISASIIGLATLAVILSNNAATAGVLTAFGNAYAGIITAAVSPVTGGKSLASQITGK